jgi:NTP pyrophosphatase (non-canonical NTP hydrolase)
MNRDMSSIQEVEAAFDDLADMLEKRILEKGEGLFTSAHESLGVIEEEHYELIDAVRSNDPEKIKKEMLDVAVAAFWGYVTAKNQYPGLN